MDTNQKPIGELIAPMLEGLTLATEAPPEAEPTTTPGEARGLLPPTWASSRGVPDLFVAQLYGDDPPDETLPLRACRRWLVVDPRPRSLVLAGSVGTGKSYAAALVVCSCRDRSNGDGPGAYFVTADDYAQAVRDRDRRVSKSARLARVLVLDDLGDEFPDGAGFHAHTLRQLIAGRHRDGLATIATTNLDRGQVAKRYGERIADRLGEGGAWLDCPGESLRK